MRPVIRSLISQPDRVSGFSLALVAVLALSQAIHLPFGSVQAPDAGFFPVTLSVLLLLFALAVIANSFVRAQQQPEFTSRSWYMLAAAFGFIIYAVVVDKVGFVLTTSIILLLLMRAVGGISWVRALAIAVSGVVLSYLLFIELGVPLPRGVMPF